MVCLASANVEEDLNLIFGAGASQLTLEQQGGNKEVLDDDGSQGSDTPTLKDGSMDTSTPMRDRSRSRGRRRSRGSERGSQYSPSPIRQRLGSEIDPGGTLSSGGEVKTNEVFEVNMLQRNELKSSLNEEVPSSSVKCPDEVDPSLSESSF